MVHSDTDLWDIQPCSLKEYLFTFLEERATLIFMLEEADIGASRMCSD